VRCTEVNRDTPDNVFADDQCRRFGAHHAANLQKQPAVDLAPRFFGGYVDLKALLEVNCTFAFFDF
jgi:hypothetical protein